MNYSEEELELIDKMYIGNGDKAECTYQNIASECNEFFHKGKSIRTISSISYALNKLYKIKEAE